MTTFETDEAPGAKPRTRRSPARPGASGPVRAVQYLRRSTEHQRYSLDSQSEAIASFARRHGLQIVRSYVDSGRSGLSLKGRRALQALLRDALAPDRDFEVVLVLDVSRWGRFQDPDQAAHYEYLCRNAGARLLYCSEQFDNEGGLVDTVFKHLKRVMAAEYSRELSDKVSRAQLRQAGLGYRQGGVPPYGFRRQLLDERGAPRRLLAFGERKAANVERVVSVPGPAEEVAIVRRIFERFVHERASFTAIARDLNAEGVPTGSGLPWSAKRISSLIKNEICIGTYVYNRTSQRMHKGVKRRATSELVRAPMGAAVVPDTLFWEARRLDREGCWRSRTDEAMLQALRDLLARRGHLTYEMIDQTPDMPSTTVYATRFGSLRAAYKLIGYQPGPGLWDPRIAGHWTRERIIEGVRAAFKRHGYVTEGLLAEAPDLPSAYLIRKRFGTLRACYEAADVPHTLEEIRQSAATRRAAQFRAAEARIAAAPAPIEVEVEAGERTSRGATPPPDPLG